MDRSQKFCVIGAGPSGLTVLKNFQQRGIPCEGIEREDDVGGNWYYGRPCSSVYDSTHMISSKRMTEYADFPMPREFPPYPSHRQALEYLRSYAQHFSLYDNIEFKRSVQRVEADGTGWLVTLDDGQPPRRYRGVVVANGHHSEPLRPEFSGTFSGTILHSHDYKTPDTLHGKRVLIVGAGNSGCDIAVEAAQHAKAAFLSLRRGYHFLPKFLFGRPIDSGGDRFHRWHLPVWLRRTLTAAMVRVAVGRPETYGLPKPDHRLFETHPIVNSQLLYFTGHGRIKIKPDIERLADDRVRFRDGSEEPFDLIILATGYRIRFPFLDERLLCDTTGQPQLFLNVFHPDRDNLFVAGLIQPNSGLWGLADYQAQLISAVILATEKKSERFAWFWRLKQTRQAKMNGGVRFVDSPRHAIEVDYFAYRKELKRLIKKFQE